MYKILLNRATPFQLISATIVLGIILGVGIIGILSIGGGANSASQYGERIDRVAGHPDDPQLPPGTLGASDAVLAATEAMEIASLLRETRAFAESRPSEPRFMFALGRAALFHGYSRAGGELLQKAAKNGSAAAIAYQGYAAEANGDYEMAAVKLKQAIDMGFQSQDAKDTLAMLKEFPPQSADVAGGGAAYAGGMAPMKEFDPQNFNRPKIIQALYDNDVAVLNENRRVALFYTAWLHNKIADQSILYIVENRNIIHEIDPTVSTRIAQTVLSTQGMERSINNLKGLLGNWLEARKRGTVQDEMQVIMQPALNIDHLKQQAEQDGTKLALTFDRDPEAFRKVYAGIKKFVKGK